MAIPLNPKVYDDTFARELRTLTSTRENIIASAEDTTSAVPATVDDRFNEQTKLDEFPVLRLDRLTSWGPTSSLRIFKSQIQQLWLDRQSGETEWRPLPVVEE